MNAILSNTLIWHVFLGITATTAFAGICLFLNQKTPNIKWLKIYALLGFLGFLASWILGGFYYTSYYGQAVKPIILKGQTPWIHQLLMESKEHIFLFLPFLSLAVLITIYAYSKTLAKNKKLKKSLLLLCFLTTSLGIIITLSGIAISGAVTRN